MIVDHTSKTVFLSSDDVPTLLKGFKCPCCNKQAQCNGTGPANKPWLTRALHTLPSEHIIGGLPSCSHDLAYLICPMGWAVHVVYGDLEVTAVDRDSADLMYKDLMHAQVERRAAFGSKWWYHQCADRNYQAVQVGGESSYAHTH